MVKDNKEEVGDRETDAAYHLRFEVHLLSGLGRRGDLAGRRHTPDKPLRHRELSFGEQIIEIAGGDIRVAPLSLVGVTFLLQWLQPRWNMAAAGGFNHRRMQHHHALWRDVDRA